ncbi:MAG: hypothetical protein ACMUJI_12875 [Erythrobacter sp.]|uniref:hypothetical protein n=1 Tax=Erythrobacter TaxID=1041 RepID=UPI0005522318|nr:hypothetical protein [Erythrobacter aurantius]
MNSIARYLVSASACGALVATPALAEKANDLTYLNGRNAAEVERTIYDRGFRHVSSHRTSGGFANSYWWQERGDNCIVVETSERSGQVMTINDAPNKDCGHSGGISGGEAAAIGVGAVLLGALLAGGKSHHREGRDYDETQTAEFDRGYRDGLHHAGYHNYNRDDAYAHGYEKGTEEREANLRDHHRRGGYAQVARFDDLQNARAAGGMSELERRGFRQVDNFTSGNTRYSIQWRPESRQCVQVTIADGRFYDLRDIGQHPNCR